MFKFIIDPENKLKLNINSKKAKYLLLNYIKKYKFNAGSLKNVSGSKKWCDSKKNYYWNHELGGCYVKNKDWCDKKIDSVWYKNKCTQIKKFARDDNYIGKGANGYIYKYVKDSENKYVIKWIVFNPQNIENINNEIKILQKINNPFCLNIPKHLKVYRDDKNRSIYIPLPYFNGGDLNKLSKKLLDNRINFNPEFLAYFSIILYLNLHYLHFNNIIHRDIKLDNLMIHNYFPRIIDFGISKIIDNKTFLEDQTGTPAYFSIAHLKKKYTCDVDYYSLTIVMYLLNNPSIIYEHENVNMSQLINRIIDDEFYLDKIKKDNKFYKLYDFILLNDFFKCHCESCDCIINIIKKREKKNRIIGLIDRNETKIENLDYLNIIDTPEYIEKLNDEEDKLNKLNAKLLEKYHNISKELKEDEKKLYMDNYPNCPNPYNSKLCHDKKYLIKTILNYFNEYIYTDEESLQNLLNTVEKDIVNEEELLTNLDNIWIGESKKNIRINYVEYMKTLT